MEKDRRFDSVFSKKVNAGKRRTYFFDVRQTRGDDFYLTLTESTKRQNGDGFERHKIFLYKEDFNRFITNLEEVITYIKTELMPDYDYEEFDRKHEEWDAQEDHSEHHERQDRGRGGGGQDDSPRPPRRRHQDDDGHREPEKDNDDHNDLPKPTSQPPRAPSRFDDDLSW